MSEEKTRIHARITEDTERKIAAAMPLADCRSQNEFVEMALQFYCDYLIAGDCSSVPPPIYLSALGATIQCSEDRASRLMFKHSVELDMVVNVPTAGMEIPEENLRDLRARYIQNVKETRSSATLEKAVDRVARYEDRLAELLDEDGQHIPERLTRSRQEIDSITATENFILGFRLGVRLMAEALDDNDGDIKNRGK